MKSACVLLLLLLLLLCRRSPTERNFFSGRLSTAGPIELTAQPFRSSVVPAAAAFDRMQCQRCKAARAVLKRPKDGSRVCRDCFFALFEEEVHLTIVRSDLFHPGQSVGIAASGGKDSTVLAHVMTKLNAERGYGLRLCLLSIDEGITGYRDDSLETVKRNADQYALQLTVLSYQQLYGWSMDAIVREIGHKNNCTFCGVFRRQALDRGAQLLNVDTICTGHNADDIAETVLLNLLRGDVPRLQRCTNIITGGDGPIPRCKPFKYSCVAPPCQQRATAATPLPAARYCCHWRHLFSSYEKEIVMYAYFKKLDYFSTECIYSPNAYRGFARQLIKDAERLDAGVILDIVHAGETMQFRSGEAGHASTAAGSCERCGYISSQRLCKACVLLDDLATRSSRHVKVEYEAQAEAGSASAAVASCGGKLSW